MQKGKKTTFYSSVTKLLVST